MHTAEQLSDGTHGYITAVTTDIARTYTSSEVTTWDQVYYVRDATRAAYLEAYLYVLNHGMPADPPERVRAGVAWIGSNNPLLRMDHATAAERFPHLLTVLADAVAYGTAVIAAQEANARMTAYETLAA